MYPLQRLIIIYILKNKNKKNSDLIVPCQVKGHRSASLTVAVNTRTVLAIVPPQGCEAILVEILQLKRSAGGPHFTCCFLKSE